MSKRINEGNKWIVKKVKELEESGVIEVKGIKF